ncbi:microsomal dipeptidase-like Zn-dependent dipeptidase [Flavobacterium sp. 90]|uniref:dipeptidase n=1 Tax=Flavobacterium sp. 90 TaxID=2135622 RepID=UPI000F1496B0|nr:membrane dipeptidase [Flavobacterium sp. 90]RKR11841.1 LOW QUALITY PROTEIN: microsomal dipeptidase-like Zn-dependent dipeptidase [Flavobacterium sp. 81]TCK55615.1 microsomal dipeptidase-like Zn-dependent dipeptidase [Flavobacterium sp. 90]
MSSNQEWNRRSFLTAMSGAGAAIMLSPFLSWAAIDRDPRIAEIVARTLGIDTHNHIDVPLIKSELPGPKVDLAGELKKSGLSAICMTFAVDYQKLVNPGDAYERFINGLSAMDEILKSNNMKRALNFADLQLAHKIKQPIVIQSVEGGHFLEGKIERLQIAYDRGLRHLGLLHDNDASVPLGDIFTKSPQWGGLTTFGAEVIKECERIGVLVDLSHCDDNTVNGALKIAKKPVLISHTGLNSRLGQNEFMSKMMKPRLISKEQARIVADNGGVIGVWTHLADSPTEFADNIKAMVDVVGVDHVCIGTDTKLTPAYRSPNDQGQRPENGKKEDGKQVGFENKQNGQPKKENDKKNQKGPQDTNHSWEVQKDGFYYTVVEALLNAGFKEEEIAKIGGGNYCRIFDAATKK